MRNNPKNTVLKYSTVKVNIDLNELRTKQKELIKAIDN